MKTTLCKNCGSVIEASNKDHFCSKSCKRKYIRNKIFFWGGITLGTAGAGFVGYKVLKSVNTIYDEMYSEVNPKKTPNTSTIPAIPMIQEKKEDVSILEKDIITEVVPSEYKEVELDPFLRKLPENWHPSTNAISNALENGIELDPEGHTTYVREQTRNYMVS